VIAAVVPQAYSKHAANCASMHLVTIGVLVYTAVRNGQACREQQLSPYNGTPQTVVASFQSTISHFGSMVCYINVHIYSNAVYGLLPCTSTIIAMP
jgi:hypothetical protein